MTRPITHRNLPQLLLKTREALLGHFRLIINHFGLTEQQWRIIRTLDEYGDMEPNQLCDACQILSPSMTGVLARMKALDLVDRRRVSTDQRRILISLTPLSKDLCRRMAPLIETQYALIEKTVGRTLLNDTYAQLDRLLATALNEVPAISLPPVPHRPNKRTTPRIKP
ncbi:homoprotocatechuate degradation operon regulator HpaR [Alcaligenaceae bacterium CGII-47]|nr:homoprotocatechuate degradation operon regulator HpaR [Alcaligenaceae bacterium CGII-47]